MLPSSTSNDTYDARRRNSVRRSLAGTAGGTGNGPDDDQYVSPLLVAMDSPAARVAARKRKLLHNRQQSTKRGEESLKTVPSIISEELQLPESFKLKANRKKLISSDSSRSLDSAAKMLEREKVKEQLHRPDSPKRRSRSHHQRITMPLVGNTSLDSSTMSATAGGSSGLPSALRSSLSEFKKSMIRHMKQNKSSGHPAEKQDIKSASERRARTVPPPQEASLSEHRRSWPINIKQLGMLGSDANLAMAVADEITNGTEESSTELQQSKVSNSAAAPNPGLIKKLLSSGRLSRSVSGRGSSNRLNTSSSSKHFSSLDSDDDSLSTSLDLEGRCPSEVKSAATLSVFATMPEAGHDSEDDEKDHSRRPLTVVLSSRLKRKETRAELVKQLTARDSLRVRDRARAARGIRQGEMDTSSIVSEQPATPPGTEFSTEEEAPVVDSKLPAKLQGASKAPRAANSEVPSTRGKKLSPFDDGDYDHPIQQSLVLREEVPLTSRITPSSIAAILSSTTFSSTLSLVEGEGVRNKRAARHKPIEDETSTTNHHGHPPSPVASGEQDRMPSNQKNRRRSSSLPSATRDISVVLSATKKNKGLQDKQDTCRHSSIDDKPRLSSSTNREARREESHGHKSLESIPSSSQHPRRSSSLRPKAASSHAAKGDREIKSQKNRHSTHSKSRRSEVGSYASLWTSSSKLDKSRTMDAARKESYPEQLAHRQRQQSSSKKQQRRQEATSASTMNDQVENDQEENLGYKRKSPKAPSKTKALSDVSDQSLTLDDLAKLDDSSQCVSRTEFADKTTSNKKSMKKGDRLSSSAPRHHTSSGRPLSRPRLVSDSNLVKDSSGATSLTDNDGSGGVPGRKSEPRRKKITGRSSTADKLLTRKSASRVKESGSSRSLGKSPKNQHSVREQSRNAKSGIDAKDEVAASSKSKRSPRREKTDQYNKPKQSSRKHYDDVDTELLLKRNPLSAPEVPKEPQCEKPTQPSAASTKRLEEPKASIRPRRRQREKGAQMDKRPVALSAVVAGHIINNESVSSLPPLTNFLSVDLSTESSKTDSSTSAEGKSRETTPPTARRGETTEPLCDFKAAITIKRGKASSEEVRANYNGMATSSDSEEYPMKEDPFSQLDAIADDCKTDTGLNGLDGSKSRDRLVDIFLDSPSGSPLSCSLPQLWQPQPETAVLGRLVSSMPNADYQHVANVHTTADGTGGPLSCPRSSCGDDDEGVFQDHSDDSLESRELPALEPICDEDHVDVMSRIAEQIEERRISLTRLSPRTKLLGFASSSRTDITSEASPASPAEETNVTVASPRVARTVHSRGKLDRGPAMPRRSNSFEKGNSVSHDSGEPPVELEVCAAQDRGLNDAAVIDTRSMPVSLEFNSKSMQFRRTDFDGWVLAASVSGGSQSQCSETRAIISNSEAPQQQQLDRIEIESSPMSPCLRRIASMSDLEMAGSLVNDDQWRARFGKFQRSENAPFFPRQSYPSTSDRVSQSMGADELRNLYSFPPKVVGGKSFERNYLPASLQSAARRYERAGKQSPLRTRSTEERGEMSHIKKTSLDPDGTGNTIINAIEESIAVEPGLSDMFEMIGELEDDLIKFENQVAFLRARRAGRRLKEDSTDDGTDG